VQKIKIRLPATLTSFGPGVQSLSLALGLYTHVEISARTDDQLIVETSGEGAGQYAIGLRHPVVLALMRVFQHEERAPSGINIHIDNQIPLNSGLGAEAAFMVAGVIGGNNLMGNPFKREEMIQFAAKITGSPDSTVTSILGGLTASMIDDEQIIYRSLPTQSFKLIVAVPDIDNYAAPDLPEQIKHSQAIYNLQRTPLVMEALREGNIANLAQSIGDQIHASVITKRISGYAHVAEVARLAGTLATTTSGSGPAMIFLAEKRLDEIAAVIANAFKNLAIPAKVMVVPTDSQGVVISMMQSA